MKDNTQKRAQPDHPIDDAIAARYSPYAFDPRPLDDAKLLSCLEAARWAASSFNEQPWRFIIAKREVEAAFGRLLSCLMEANQAWAKDASVLILTVAKDSFTRNNNPNRVAEHDIGLAMGNLTHQASILDLAVHQMAGINIAKIRQEFGVPEGFDPVTAVALGYAADPAKADESFRERDQAPRSRKPLSEWVFDDKWDQPAKVVKG